VARSAPAGADRGCVIKVFSVLQGTRIIGGAACTFRAAQSRAMRRSTLLCHVLWILLCLCGCAARAAVERGGAERAMQAVPLAPGEHLRLTGRLDHPAWRRAPVFDQFLERDPTPGAPPPQATRVQLLYDDQALYVGITVLDSGPAQIRRPLVRHDQVNRTQDFVVVYIDAIGSRRSAQFFRVNAAGSLADGLHTASDDSEDFAPDFDWDAQVAPHPQGWTTVLRLPFASLRFADGDQDHWRIMVARRLPRESFHLITSVPVPHDSASFIDHLQPLQGVQLPQQQGFLILRPSLTVRSTRDQPADGSVQRSTAVDASLDLKWRPLAELVIDGTLNPDFSQVALDVPQLSGNTRFALSIAEKRPFFFESADLLRTPTEAFYTRSFTAPRGGLRTTWRGRQLAGTALLVDDRGGGLVLLPGAFGTDAVDQPASRTLAARGRSDEGQLQWGGVLATRRYTGADGQGLGDNTVLGPDLTWRLNEAWRLRAQWLHARTTALPDAQGSLARAAAVDGDRWFLRLNRNTGTAESDITLDDIGSGFRHDSGFVSQAGVRKFSWFESRGWRPAGPFHQFWVNLNVRRTEDRATGRTVEQHVFPGVWGTAARNLEWWFELHPLAQVRATPDGPLLAQRYVATGLVMTPARWFPLLDTNVEIGRLADTRDERVRSGVRWNTSAKLRPLPALELEPTVSLSWLGGDGARAYDERLVNLLAVWHLGPRSHLRAILQRAQLDRDATRLQRGQEQSLTWSWRPSTGSVFYLGLSRFKQGVNATARGTEAFVKLQVDLDDARAALVSGP
jgi:hypothetical protein